MGYHLAQINIGRLVAPIDNPRIADFVAQLAPINALADSAPGFVWRLQSESGNATDIPFSDDPTVMVNMSVWESIEALRDFTYASRHTAPLQGPRKVVRENGQAALLPVVGACRPYPDCGWGRERLLHFQEHGATPHSFWFSQQFPAPAEDPVCA